MPVSVRKTILTIVRITRGINFSLGKCHIDSAVEILLIIVKFIVIAFICQNKMDIKNGSKKPSSLGEEPCWGKLPVLNHAALKRFLSQSSGKQRKTDAIQDHFRLQN